MNRVCNIGGVRPIHRRLSAETWLILSFVVVGMGIAGLFALHKSLWGRSDKPELTSAFPAALINEILPHTDPPLVDSIELFNPTANDVTLDGWCLSDDSDAPCRYRFPVGTIISANGYLVLNQEQFGFGLSEMGESLLLSEADATGSLTGARHHVRFDATANGVPLGRLVTSDGQEHFPPLTHITLGAANAPPLVGPIVIAEIMYHPPPGKDEYIELVNISAQRVALFSESAPRHLWRLTGVGDFSFPDGLMLPAHASLFVTPLAPDDFRARQGLTDDVLVVGPYRGALSDSGEEIVLWQPGEMNADGTFPYLSVDRVAYRDRSPWPSAPDGDGSALQRRDATSFGGEPQNWQASVESTNNAPLIELVEFVAAPSPNGPYRQLRWKTQRERNAVGFTLWRSEGDNRAAALQLGGGVVVSRGGRHLGAAYTLDDPTADWAQSYTYWLAVVNASQVSADLDSVFSHPLQHNYLPFATAD